MPPEQTNETQTQTTSTQQSNEGGAQPQTQQGASTEAQNGGSTKTERPDWLSEQFWDPEAGQIKGSDLKAHLDELAAFKAGEDSRRAAAPEKPDGYQLQLPADLELPEGMSFEFDENDPMVGLGRQIAHAVGLDQAGFENLMLKPFIEARVAAVNAENARITELTEANDKALGPKAADRRAAVENFIAAKLGVEYADVFKHILPVAKAVEGFERLMRLSSSGGMPGFTQTGRSGGSTLSEDEYQAMSPAQRLAHARRAANGSR
ncbi:hypothetical protein DC522_05905 [Microvirga sp. KLBC 81]|uniref:hypothetical protein n=1 Tax=Microvirga sp. KLBC 81 TaxID=1862707 RepID=UPI000D511D0C|nr:hypothetical protein [Microvirga sp. KLBC 81]PVE25427.1 hypothetical protein DC522_05905 [Microvirga sp. KLBC 81]